MTLSELQKTSLESMVSLFQTRIGEAGPYLSGRGFTPEHAAAFRLGVVPADVPGYEQYAGRLAIPYLTPTGCVDIRFRSLGGDSPKYMSRPGSHGHMYNVGVFQQRGDLVAVCEGEIDAMTATMCGIPTIGIPGANGWKSLWNRAFQDYSQVLVFCDGDDPGREFGKKVRKDVEEATVIHLPEGEDVNSLVVAHGAEALRERAGL